MPLYAAYLGDANNLPVPEPGSFCLRDGLGRDWTCREGLAPSPAGEEGVDLAVEMLFLQKRLERLGLGREGSHLHVGEYDSVEALREALTADG